MSYQTGSRGPPQELFIQELVFTPEMVQSTPADLELGVVSGDTILYRKKNSNDVGTFDLAKRRAGGQFAAEGLPITSKPGGGCLSQDGTTFACLKSKALFGSALRVIETQTNAKSKSLAVDVGPTYLSTFTPAKSLIIADPTKRSISLWPLATIAKQPPRKLSLFGDGFPDGVISKLVDVAFHGDGEGGGGGDAGWVLMTEWIQWPLLKAGPNPAFQAGLMRVVRVGGGPDDVRDVWAHAGTIVQVPVQGQWTKLLCYADRTSPQDHMVLHFRTPIPPLLQPHERSPIEPDFLHFSTKIPTYDATDVPKAVLALPAAQAVVVITVSGMLHAFGVDATLIGSEQLQHMPPRGADLACSASLDGGQVYVKVGPIVIGVRVGDVRR